MIKVFSLFALAVAFAATADCAEPASIFSDHMVLQRDKDIPIWGRGDANETVTIQFAGQIATARTGKDGTWRVDLEPLPASEEPRILRIESSSGKKPIEIKNVLVGDVWVGSGQSNMAGKVAAYAKKDANLARLMEQQTFPTIRLMLGGPKSTWKEADSSTVPEFSALLFAFGERLNRELHVPIGLIVGAVGGTPSGSWIPEETWIGSEKCKTEIAEFAKTYDPELAIAKYEKQVKAWEQRVADAESKGEKPKGRKPLPPAKPGESIRGGKIGGLYERYISAAEGYAIRGVLWDQGEARSGVLGVDQHTMMSELIRGWREAWDQGEFPFLFVQKPSGGGCAWPEENPVTALAGKFSGLPQINNVGTAETNFLYVRLMRDNSNSWMVPVSDLAPGVHPTNKWGYGQRAAAVALQKAYGTANVQAYGPRYRSHRIEGGKIVVEFDEVGKGLTTAHSDTLQGFAVAGRDGQWHWADARIEGETVIVSSPDVPSPTQIRYAWAQKHPWANLFNKDGLPALVFTTGGAGE